MAFKWLAVAGYSESPLRLNRDLSCTNNIWLDELSALLGLYKLNGLAKKLGVVPFKTSKVSRKI